MTIDQVNARIDEIEQTARQVEGWLGVESKASRDLRWLVSVSRFGIRGLQIAKDSRTLEIATFVINDALKAIRELEG